MTELPHGSRGEFSVYMFFPDDSWNRERDHVSAEEAMAVAVNCTQRPAVALGIIKRVIITDADDFTCWDWRAGEGVVFPTKEIEADIIGE